MSRWVRWYEGTVEDGKFRVIARKSRVTVRDVLALWAFILEDAGHLDHRGVCERDEDFMASVLDFEDGTVERILEAMQDLGMVSVGAGAITVCNWNKRQFESDADTTAARRQRDKRERDNKKSHARVTRDSGGSESETDTESETEKNPPGGAPAPAVEEFRTPSKVLFDEGVKFLSKRGQADRNARSLIGKWRKNIGDPALLEVLSQAMREEVSDVVPWIEQAVKARENGSSGSATRGGNGHRRVSAGDAVIAAVADLGREFSFEDRGRRPDDLETPGQLLLEPGRGR